MKLKHIASLLRDYFRPGANTTALSGNIMKVPAGMVPDASAVYGLIGLMQNIDAIDWDLGVVISSAATLTLTAAQFYQQIIDYSGAPAGGVTVTTPTAAQIIAQVNAYGTAPGDGFNFPLFFMNDGTGQTITLNGGTGVTITGNNTMATNTCRHFLCNVNINAGTVTLVNFGTVNL